MNGVPMLPLSIMFLRYRTAGLYLNVKPTLVFRPLLAARSATRRTSRKSCATGFSLSTCLPASMAATLISKCSESPVTTSMMSMSSRLSSSR